MFIPYRARIKATRFPVMTVVVAVVCLLVFWAQSRNETQIEKSATAFCADPEIARPIERGHQQVNVLNSFNCAELLVHLYLRGDGEQHLVWHVERIRQAGDAEAAEALERQYRAFTQQAPRFLTAQLWHHAGSWNPLRLLTSAVSHGSWDHVIGNLFFFLAFGMVVETVIGPALFLLVFLAMAFGTGALENIVRMSHDGVPSLGLSGVVMSVMTLAAWFAPQVRIKFFFFYFLFFGVVSWPLWGVAGWYVFWDLWNNYFYGKWSYINHVAHLAGAVFGLILGITVFRHKRHWAQEHIVRDEPTLKDEESWFYKLNTFAATPVVAYFIFFYGMAALLIGLYLLITFMQTFAAQLLIAAPVVAGLIKIYRMKQPKKPNWARLQEGMKCLDEHRFQEAEKILRPLAESGYPRGQFALGRYYASVPGAYHNDPQAVRWFAAAAERGLAEAHQELGTRYYHGLGVVKDLPNAIYHLEHAARKGLGDAASTLGHLYANGPKGIADNEKAMEWFYKAGVAYHQAGRRDDALAVIKELQTAAANYPAVYQLIAELEKLVITKYATSG